VRPPDAVRVYARVADTRLRGWVMARLPPSVSDSAASLVAALAPTGAPRRLAQKRCTRSYGKRR